MADNDLEMFLTLFQLWLRRRRLWNIRPSQGNNCLFISKHKNPQISWVNWFISCSLECHVNSVNSLHSILLSPVTDRMAGMVTGIIHFFLTAPRILGSRHYIFVLFTLDSDNRCCPTCTESSTFLQTTHLITLTAIIGRPVGTIW